MVFEVDLVSAPETENLEQFQTRVMRAEMNGHSRIEANEEICRAYCPHGMGTYNPFFNTGKKLRVYLKGTMTGRETQEAKQHHQSMHGDVGFFEGRQT